MTHTALSMQELLEYIPQQAPFRFIDEITFVNESKIEALYTFKKDLSFYAGHFPGNPVTPGVILLETMAQAGVVAFGIYLLSLEHSKEEIKHWLTFFTDAEVEFFRPVYPGETVTIKAEKVFWRRMKLKSKVILLNQNGDMVASSSLSGIGVKQ